MADHAECHRDIDQLLIHVGDLQRALRDIQRVICVLDGPLWEDAQGANDPLWRALDQIDGIALKALTYRVQHIIDGSEGGNE